MRLDDALEVAVAHPRPVTRGAERDRRFRIRRLDDRAVRVRHRDATGELGAVGAVALGDRRDEPVDRAAVVPRADVAVTPDAPHDVDVVDAREALARREVRLALADGQRVGAIL